MNLFQKNYAKGDLFGSNSKLITNRENVYYSGAKRKLAFPGRVFLYTSKYGKNRGMEISACSKIEEIHFGDGKELYKKNRHLGVFEFKHIKRISNNFQKSILAIKFSDTFIFPSSVPLDEMVKIGLFVPQSITYIRRKEILYKVHERFS